MRCAENGAEALELLHDDPCDVVLLDIVMRLNSTACRSWST